MDCGIPFCHTGCPLGNLIPEWNDLVYRDDWREAMRAAARHEQLPGVHRPPVPGAVRGRVRARHQRGRRSTIKQVEVEIVDHGVGATAGVVAGAARRSQTGKRVAVVGSGPAGLAAAQQLTRAGHDGRRSTSAPIASAGCCATASPSSRWRSGTSTAASSRWRPKAPSSASNANVGENVPVDELAAESDAIVLAGGATAWRDLPIPGRELTGIYQAMEFLPPSNRVQEGDLAEHPFSADGQARRHHRRRRHRRRLPRHRDRQGCASVHQFEILPRPPDERPDANPWPTWPMIYRDRRPRTRRAASASSR